ncbi:cobyrinic acid a,c-diamide synthase [Sinosporangium album]|uniref:Hydrogenobyrinate a,c-diamide synthase n=1 Tax=Sinosporangium album TaxID=504805 RepID=A0A1G8I5Q5_9ACTN|nr:cobyrinate a,c-diamide synthase [Sinosporangium album]SDI14295.1 cobyrinic acid a,c-diamide synthase [Sinosporangium album]
MVAVPRLVVAAPASGTGKTTVATGLMAALADRGHTVSPHKVGPDYIDPGYHALATGRPGRNLDPWLQSEDLVAPLFLHGAAGADIAVIEGVMGLYDGVVGMGDHASTAHVARLLDAPVVLVVDAAGQARSVAALVAGFAGFDTRVRLGGVILNGLGSERHERICRDALDEIGVPVLGALRKTPGVATPSRHLGLVPAAERRAEARRTVEALGELVAAGCDIPALVRLAHSAPGLAARPWNPADALASAGGYVPAAGIPTAGIPAAGGTASGEGRGREAGAVAAGSGAGAGGGARAEDTRPRSGPGRPVVAVAGGAAFTFGYAEQSELLAAAGADVAVFDPLRDEALPDGTRALVVGGGFPEVYAAELSANEPLRKSVADFDGTIAAECAGLLYLTRELDGLPMCGLVDAVATMTPRLTLGYRDAVAVRDTALTRVGERYRGHEFHRTAVSPGSADPPVFRWRDGADGFAPGRVVASYLHLHWAATPHLAHRLLTA